jgi:pyruvate kinase
LSHEHFYSRAQSRRLAGSQNNVCAIAFDIKGPEVRVGRFGPSVAGSSHSNGAGTGTVTSVGAGAGAGVGAKHVDFKKGARFTFTTDVAKADLGSSSEIFISYKNIARRVRPGQLIFIDDGNMEVQVVSTDPDRGTVLVECVTAGPIGERKNVNIPGMALDLPAVTAKDRIDIATARELGADYLFASFVESADAVKQIRALAGPHLRIVSKIESQAGIDNYDEILSASDGIMVARGDLGVQIPAERVFLAQKMMTARANIKGKALICATQMLESMISHPRPTRAEIVDIASACLDGADAVMLSGETAKGAFPLEAVRVMSRTCLAAETAFPSRSFFTALSDHPATPIGIDQDEALLYHETGHMRLWQKAADCEDNGGVSDDESDDAFPRDGNTNANANANATKNQNHNVNIEDTDVKASTSEQSQQAGFMKTPVFDKSGTGNGKKDIFAHRNSTARNQHPGDVVKSSTDEFMTIADVETLASSAVHATFEISAKAIIVMSVSGRTAQCVAKYRPACPVICLVSDPAVARQMQLYRGLNAVLIPPETHAGGAASLRDFALKLTKFWGLTSPGDRVVVVNGAVEADTHAGMGIAVTIAKVK